MPAEITRAQMTDTFRQAGLIAGDSVIIHSSFRSLGPVAGGPDAVLDALLEVIGPRGNLMLPTFNYTRPLPEPYYDPATTPARTGIIVETGRKRPGAVRSLHPTHSVAVIGPDAEALTRDHLIGRAFGIGSPIDRLAQRGGKVLFLGVSHTANSTIHVGEEHAGLPKAGWSDRPLVVRVRMPDGVIREHEIDTSPSCSAAFGAAEYALRRQGEIRDLRLGSCMIQLMLGRDVIRRTQALLQEKPDILLCTWSQCRPCTGARANLKRAGKL